MYIADDNYNYKLLHLRQFSVCLLAVGDKDQVDDIMNRVTTGSRQRDPARNDEALYIYKFDFGSAKYQRDSLLQSTTSGISHSITLIIVANTYIWAHPVIPSVPFCPKRENLSPPSNSHFDLPNDDHSDRVLSVYLHLLQLHRKLTLKVMNVRNESQQFVNANHRNLNAMQISNLRSTKAMI